MPRKIEVTELILRDAHQSLMATRMALEDMVPATMPVTGRQNAGVGRRSIPAFAF
jgi:pyruvate/oxaloacetate carboxyltransferase